MKLLKSPTVFVVVLELLHSGFHGARADKISCAPGSHNVTNLSPDADPRAPDIFQVSWSTSAGEKPIVLEVVREWCPLGVDHFYQLVLDNFFNCAAFFRVAPGFVVQFGLASNPMQTEKWNAEIPDDPVVKSNLYSYVSFAQTGEPNSRGSQIFINIGDNPKLDDSGFTPFARVVLGMDVVENIYNPTPYSSRGLDQEKLHTLGNDWILAEYPDVDIITGTGDIPSSAALLAVPSLAAWTIPEAVQATLDVYDAKISCAPGSHNVTNLSPDADPRAPDIFQVSWSTSAGEKPIVLEVVREWSPLGVDHFYQLVLDNFFNCAAFFRVAPGFVVQFGLASNPMQTEKWNAEIPDDPVVKSNLYSYVSFAQTGEPNSRGSQIFINIGDNPKLDDSGFTPFARVVLGMDVVENIYNPTPSFSRGLDQEKVHNLGNDWILAEYPGVEIITGTDGPNSAAALTVPSSAAWIVLAAVLATILGGVLC